MWNMWHIGEECQCYQLPYQLENTKTHPLLYKFLRINKWCTAKFQYHEDYLALQNVLRYDFTIYFKASYQMIEGK